MDKLTRKLKKNNFHYAAVQIISDNAIKKVLPALLKTKDQDMQSGIPVFWIKARFDDKDFYFIAFFKLFVTSNFKKIAFSFSRFDGSFSMDAIKFGYMLEIKNKNLFNSIPEDFIYSFIHKIESSYKNIIIEEVDLITDLAGIELVHNMILYSYPVTVNLFEAYEYQKIKNNFITLYKFYSKTGDVIEEKSAILNKDVLFLFDEPFDKKLASINTSCLSTTKYSISCLSKGENDGL